jgi:hypothetical protein
MSTTTHSGLSPGRPRDRRGLEPDAGVVAEAVETAAGVEVRDHRRDGGLAVRIRHHHPRARAGERAKERVADVDAGPPRRTARPADVATPSPPFRQLAPFLLRMCEPAPSTTVPCRSMLPSQWKQE